MAKKILSVFSTAADAYLEYVNSGSTMEEFMEAFNLERNEVQRLIVAAHRARKITTHYKGKWLDLDYWFNQTHVQSKYFGPTLYE
ncbi:MAG: hypothetical protein K5854_01635 [Prevotella sp.]|nr:hypothetical protein [Prevotella sp.]